MDARDLEGFLDRDETYRDTQKRHDEDRLNNTVLDNYRLNNENELLKAENLQLKKQLEDQKKFYTENAHDGDHAIKVYNELKDKAIEGASKSILLKLDNIDAEIVYADFLIETYENVIVCKINDRDIITRFRFDKSRHEEDYGRKFLDTFTARLAESLISSKGAEKFNNLLRDRVNSLLLEQ